MWSYVWASLSIVLVILCFFILRCCAKCKRGIYDELRDEVKLATSIIILLSLK